MGQFLSSNKIQVFPFGSDRAGTNPSRGSTLNEHNIRTLVKKLTDYTNYVVDYDSESKIIEFVIDGYYVQADLSDLTSLTDLWAVIKPTTGAYDSYLQGCDQAISANDPEGEGTEETPYSFGFNSSVKIPVSSSSSSVYLKLPASSGGTPDCVRVTFASAPTSTLVINSTTIYGGDTEVFDTSTLEEGARTLVLTLQGVTENSDIYVTFSDATTIFSGVAFETTKPTGTGIIALPLLSAGSVPRTSRKRLKAISLRVDKICCQAPSPVQESLED